MLETVGIQNGRVLLRASVRRVGVYLDNFAIIDLARGSSDRRNLFLEQLRRGADLLFSTTNAAELIETDGPESIASIRSFLDSVGPFWVPIEGHGLVDVMARERNPNGTASPVVSAWFLERLFAALNLVAHGEQRIELVEPEFFRLSVVFDWIGKHHRTATQDAMKAGEVLIFEMLARFRTAYELHPDRLDEVLPVLNYDSTRPATFAFYSLLRILLLEAKSHRLKKGDAADFMHATIASSYATFAALDKHWKARVARIPVPHGLARVYYAPELDQLVSDLTQVLDGTSRP